nr:RecName: Full=Hemocyanin subunit A; AltName: Full=CCH-A [Concholepas concholepas]
LMRKDVDTLTD